jgi:hypothetical protein
LLQVAFLAHLMTSDLVANWASLIQRGNMRVCWFAISVGLASLPVILALPAPTSAQPLAAAARIKELVAQLGDPNFKTREAAMMELGRIGVPALEELQAAEENGNSEVSRRAGMLVTSIRKAHRLPPRVAGLQFVLKIDPDFAASKPEVWPIPLRYKLEISNHFATPCQFNAATRVNARLVTSNGKEIELADDDTLSSLRGPGVSHLFSFPPIKSKECVVLASDGRLSYSKGVGDHAVGHLFLPNLGFAGRSAPLTRGLSRLPPDVYQLSLVFSNHPGSSDKAVRTWVGTVETLSETLSIE